MITNNGGVQDLKQFKVMLKDSDITQFVMDLKIYQDIFYPYVNAVLEMSDSMNFGETLKVGTLLTFKMKTKQGFDTDDDIKFALEIYDVDERISYADKMQGWTFKLANKEFRKDLKERVTQAFENKRPDQIVSECVGMLGGSVEVEKYKPSNKVTMLGANKAPLIVANMALRNTSPSADYFLYPYKIKETGQCQYKMTSFSQKKEGDEYPKQYDGKELTFKQGLYNLSESRKLNQNYQIRTYHIQETKSIMNTITGHSGSQLKSFDVMARGFNTTGKSEAVIDFQPISKGQFDKGEAMSEVSDKWYLKRKKAFYNANQYPIYFSTFGFVKSFEFLGEFAYLELNEHTSIYTSLKRNDRYKKIKFIIAAVTHHIDAQRNYRNSWKLVSWEV